MTNADVFVRECAVNTTEGYLMYEVDTPMRDTVWEELPERGEFYRFCSREFGRCVGKMFVDDANGEAIHVGYVFQKRERYEDTGDPFVRETWVGFVTKTPRAGRRGRRVVGSPGCWTRRPGGREAR